MTRVAYNGTAVNRADGSVAPNASIEVRVSSTGLLADIYDARTDGSALDNPFAAEDDGSFIFYVSEPGRYNIAATGDDGTAQLVDVVMVSELAMENPMLDAGDFIIGGAGGIPERRPSTGSPFSTYTARVGLSQIGTLDLTKYDYAVFPFTSTEGDGTVFLRKDNAGTADYTDSAGNKWIENDPSRAAPRGTLGVKYKFIAGVCRNSSGAWAFIDNADHAPTNLTGISVNADGTLKISHTPGALKVGTLLVVADDTYAKFGVIGGGSVGTTFSNVTFSAPMCYQVDMSTGTVTAPEIWGSRITAVTGTSGVTVTHPTRQTNMISTVSPVGSTVQQYDVSVSDGVTETVIYTVGNQGGYVSWNGSAWAFNGDIIDTPVISYDSGTGKLSLTHSKLADTYSLSLVGRDTPLDVRAGAISRSLVEVFFYDATGTKVTGAPTTDMKFYYDRKAKVRLNTKYGLIGVNAGMAFVHADDLTNASGNFWIFGVNEV